MKVYLSTDWAAGEGFDYSVAASGSDGSYLRDFIFHVAKDSSTGHLLVGASNNTNFDPRQDLETLANHYEVPASGWFTLQHVFHNDGGHLSVDLNLIDASGTVVFTQTLSNAADLIELAGGNRYGWFTNIDVAGGIAVDAISLGDLAGTLTETVGVTGSSVPHTVAGDIPFLDVDLTDVHTVAVAPSESGYVGQLVATVTNDTIGDGEGVVSWSFSVDDSAIDFLAAGQKLTQSYDVTISDGHGGTATQTVSVTITGTNDAAMITGAATGNVVEDTAATLITAGKLNIADVDTGESSFVAQASAAGTYGTFVLNADGNWTYSANNSQAAI